MQIKFTRVILIFRILPGYNKIMETQTSPINGSSETQCTAFLGARRIAAGALEEVVAVLKQNEPGETWEASLIFNDATGQVIEVDIRFNALELPSTLAGNQESGSAPAMADEPRAGAPTGPGRPKLGVVAREVTLLPRHWEWLNGQPGGASVALRKLVEEARRANHLKDRARQSQEAAYRFISAMAGNRDGFEEAARALFAGNRARFEELTAVWPADIRDYAGKLAAVALGAQSACG